MFEERQGDVRAIKDLDCHPIARDRIRCRFAYLSHERERRCGTVWMRKLEAQTPEPQTPAESPTPIARYVGPLRALRNQAHRRALVASLTTAAAMRLTAGIPGYIVAAPGRSRRSRGQPPTVRAGAPTSTATACR
jgi:hypothetical protein